MKIRKLFPYFYVIGLLDCDSGGQVTQWRSEFGLNYWHAEKRLKRWCGWGDGEIYENIGFWDFIKLRISAHLSG